MVRFCARYWPLRWLANLAVLLMLCAPPVSRWLQTRMPAISPMQACAETGLGRAGMFMSMAMADWAPAVGPRPVPAQVRHGAAAALAGDIHARHGGIVCDYCVIVAGLLPAALLLLGLLPWQRPPCPPLPAWRPHPAAAAWPACSARGPPRAA